jgi:hypothetical protein
MNCAIQNAPSVGFVKHEGASAIYEAVFAAR